MTKKESASNPEVAQKENVQQPITVKMENVQHSDTKKKDIVLDLEQDRKSYTFYGEPDSRASAVEFMHVLAPGASGPEPHIHTKQTETFHVISGTMIARVKGQEDMTLGPDETIAVPSQIVHSFTNGNKEEPLVLRIVVEPALDFQWFLSEAVKAGIRNGGTEKNMSLLEAGHLMWLSRDQQRIGGLPYFLQDILFGILSILARITGKAGNIAPKP